MKIKNPGAEALTYVQLYVQLSIASLSSYCAMQKHYANICK